MGFKFEYSAVVYVAFCAAIQATAAQVLLTPPARSGLSVHPLPDPEILQGSGGPVEVQSTLIYYKSFDSDSIRPWIKKLDDFIEPYHKMLNRSENWVTCRYYINLGEKEVCDVPVDDFHPCTSQNNYNYRRGSPCIFLKLDDTLNWKPNYYNSTKLISEEMPDDLKQHIREVADGRPEANTVWVSCEGESPADVEYLGPVQCIGLYLLDHRHCYIQYIPRRGFISYYFPFTNKEGYLSPLVAVLFERPTTGVVIMVKCKAWARDSLRYAHFELMID